MNIDYEQKQNLREALKELWGDNYIELDFQRLSLWEKYKYYVREMLTDTVYVNEDMSPEEVELVVNTVVCRGMGLIQNPIKISKEDILSFKENIKTNGLMPLGYPINYVDVRYLPKLKKVIEEMLDFVYKNMVE